MKIISKQTLIFSVVLIFVAGFGINVVEAKSPGKKPRNIILFIGDGMGTAQVSSALTSANRAFNLESFPYSGFSKTDSFDNYITDSGAGGTAIACGIKTRNGMIGATPDSTAATSIIELAYFSGLATGVLSTSSITHATPASFVAHNIGRENYEEIAEDFLHGTVDVFIGGGENHFRSRADGRDLAVDLEKKGYDVVYTLDDLQKSKSSKVAGLLAKEHMPPASGGREGMLSEMTKKAIDILSRNKKGFFLMVEGSMIDWACHEKDLMYSISETLDMDEAVGVARKFAEKNRNTLIVVTADHETGGMTLTGGNVKNKLVRADFINTASHTGVMVPIFSFGPGAERFSGIHDNTYFFHEFVRLLGLPK